METVLLTTTTSLAHVESSAEASLALRVDDFILCTGSALATIIRENELNLPDLQKRSFYFVRWVEDRGGKFEMSEVRCVFVGHSRQIETSFNRHLNDIECKYSRSDVQITSAVLGTLVLFCKNGQFANVDEGLREIYNRILPINRKMVGCPVTVVSTPYKNLLLFNSLSRGVISTVFGEKKSLFLTDVKLTAGCEGSPVFSIRGELIGFVLSALARCKGEWMGFSIAVHLHPLLKDWLGSTTPKIFFDIEKRYSIIGDREIDSYGAVMITTSYKWGSGILVDKRNGIILTCSHVVNYSSDERFVTIEHNRKSFVGEILYATPRGLPFDIAVIKVDASHLDDVAEFKFPTHDCVKGEAVYIISYPLFSFKKRSIKGPSVTYGHVSNVFKNAMIVTTCVSNSGSSGGALVRANGELLGIVSNNLLISNENLLLPHITVAIPSIVVLEALKCFQSTKDRNEFESLISLDRSVRNVWNLKSHFKYEIKDRIIMSTQQRVNCVQQIFLRVIFLIGLVLSNSLSQSHLTKLYRGFY